MVRTVIYVSGNTKYWESSKDTCLSSFFNTLSNCWDVFLRNSTTDYRRLELECFLTVSIHRCKSNLTVTVLTTTTGLLSVLTIDVNSLSNCFLVCNLRCTNVSFYLELSKKTVNDNFEVKLTHSGDDCLTCFCICMSSECRIFFCELSKSFTHLTLIILCLRFDSKLDNWLWEFHRLKDNWMLFITDCITSCCNLKTYSSCDITSVYLIDLSS